MNTSRLRIAHITLGLEMGGQERLLVEFARHADRSRFDLTFFSLGSRGRLAEAIDGCGWPVVSLNERPGLRPGMIWRLARRLRNAKIDVVHTHDDRPLLYGGSAAKLARVPQYVHTHHHGFLASTSRRQMLLVRLAAQLPNAFVCVSQDSARFLESHGLPGHRLTTIWNGIDLDRFVYQQPQAMGPAVTVARLSPEKDVANLLRAAALIVPVAPDFRLEIAGDGPCRGELEALAIELKVEGQVRFLGEVRDIAGLLGRARLFVLPSQTEGISLTILEAMARGLPVITTNVGGNPEVVLNGETGLLAPSRDPEALAQCMLKLWRSAADCIRMSRAGRSRVEAHFDIRRMVADYERLYQGQPLNAQIERRGVISDRKELTSLSPAGEAN